MGLGESAHLKEIAGLKTAKMHNERLAPMSEAKTRDRIEQNSPKRCTSLLNSCYNRSASPFLRISPFRNLPSRTTPSGSPVPSR